MKRALAIAAVIALTFSPAAAQDVWGWSIIIPSVTGTDVLGQTLREKSQQVPPATSHAPLARSPSSTDKAALAFVPSQERRTANFARFVAQRRAADPAAARQLEVLLANPDFIPKVDRELRRRGLRADNLADAYTTWWIQAWQVSHGQTAEPSAPAVRTVKAQAEDAFLASPGVLAAGDGDKQEFAESLLIQAVILGGALEQVKADPVQLRALAQVARQSARQFGLDLDSMALTDKGFVPAGA